MSHYLKICADCWAVILYAENEEELHENRLTIQMGSCGGKCQVREYRNVPSWFVPPKQEGRKRIYARIVFSVSEDGTKDTRKEEDKKYLVWLNQKRRGSR